MIDFQIEEAEMTDLKLCKEGKEKNVQVFHMKLRASLPADIVDALWCEDLNLGEAKRAFWLENESGEPRFTYMGGDIAFHRLYRNVTVKIMEMELPGCQIGDFSFVPMVRHRAMVDFKVTVYESPAYAVDRLFAMLKKRLPVEFAQPDVIPTEAPAGSQPDAFAGTEDGPDPLYEQAVMLVQSEDGVASISFLQRRLQIGYNRAARIVEWMEKNGVVSTPDGSGRREVIR